MENNEIKQSYVALNNYVDNGPDMFITVHDGQYTKLQTKYRHLLLRYSNDFKTLSALKLIEQSLPEIILNHPKVVSQSRAINQIQKKLEQERQTHALLKDKQKQLDQQKSKLSQELKNTKRNLMIEKRKYMKIRRIIDIESIQQKPKHMRKFLFKSNVQSQKPFQNIIAKQINQLQLLMSFKRGIKNIERKEFKTKNRNIDLVLQNIKIKRNISSVFQKKRFRDQQQMAKSWQKRLISTKCSQRSSNPNPIFRSSGYDEYDMFATHRSKQLSKNKQQLSSLDLYSKICQNKLKLSVFTSTLNNLLCKHSE